jgi:hypothetical protein
MQFVVIVIISRHKINVWRLFNARCCIFICLMMLSWRNVWTIKCRNSIHKRIWFISFPSSTLHRATMSFFYCKKVFLLQMGKSEFIFNKLLCKNKIIHRSPLKNTLTCFRECNILRDRRKYLVIVASWW